ncbi:MAG: polysaccharide biosynthesis C-terminal domain-containing protein, partial [Ktedonobacteraceae bacterium]|nr:polysaccharide biosynthesis C-terminal domain-containing protein [Ktedonobacteraceae bacterium]
LGHIAPIAIYVLGSGIGSLLTAVCAALMRMRIVFVIGFVTQALLLALGFVALKEWGVNGMLWLLAIGSLFNAAAFFLWLSRVIFVRGATYKAPLGPVLRLGISAWLTNLASGALLKQVSIILLGVFAVSLVEVGYFNLSFQLADAANYLLVAGFGGVGGAALAAAFVGKNYERLAQSWQTLIKVETLLAVTGLIFCLFNAQTVVHVLYTSKYDAVGGLFAIFLFFNILTRIVGTTIHQLTLYVTGKARWVVISQWLGIGVALVGGILLIPELGAAGALIADGFAKAITGLLMLIVVLREFPRRYPLELLNFTLRFVLALVLAALPGLLWHPTNQVQLVISALLFLLLSLILLLWIKPLSSNDLILLNDTSPRLARYFAWFARGKR